MEYGLIMRQINWRLGIKSPIVANIKITNKCNLRCKMCSDDIRTAEQKEINLEEWKNKIDELTKIGIRVIIFEGGEPTLRKEIEELIMYVKKEKIYSIMITNGVNDFSHINTDAIWVSIDGIEEFHNEVRGEGIYKKIKNNLLKAKDKNIVILSMINGKNMNKIEEFVEENRDYRIYFNWVYGYKNSELGDMRLDDKINTKQKIMELKDKGYKIFNSYKTLNNVGNQNKKCSYWLLATVDSGGNIDNNCMVRRFDSKCRCSDCDLACYLELNNIYNLDYETRENWKKMVGMDLTFGIEKYIFKDKK